MASDHRLDWVDMAKGLSIFLVVIMYCAASVGEDTGRTGFLHWTIAFAMPFRMPEFFLLSGLFLSHVIARARTAFADRRVVHYLYFYGLWAVIHIAFKQGFLAGNPAGAGSSLLWAVVEPYGVLWFIYMLAVFGIASKILYQLRAPHWAVLSIAALLQMAPIHTGSYLVDQFAEYFIYFYAGYALAYPIFRLAEWAATNVTAAIALLLGWAVINGTMVFSGGFRMDPVHIQMGWASLPGLHLLLGVLGALAICVAAALLCRISWMRWLRWLGERSLVIYVAFVLPMGIARTLLLALGIEDANVLSLITMFVAIGAPLVLWWLVQKTGLGSFLFTRPNWAHLWGTARPATASTVPAE